MIPPSSLVIRPEKSSDLIAIRTVNLKAFDSLYEANLVDLLRKRDKVLLSLVAIFDQRLVGHILFSPVTISDSAPREYVITGLAPMAVIPEFQNLGIGTALVRSGIQKCNDLEVDAVVLIGHTAFYSRFGFNPGKSYGLDSEYDAGDAFMALELKPGVLSTIEGLVRFAPEFGEVKE